MSSAKSLVGRLVPRGRDRVYLIAMTKVLDPAARWLPGWAAMAVADALGGLILLSPVGRTQRGQISLVFPDGPHRVWPTAHACLTRTLRDHVAAQRCILHRPGNMSELRNVQTAMAPAAQELLESDRSFLMANAHFSRETILAAFAPASLHGHKLTFVANPVPDPDGTLATERVRVQFGQLLESGRHINPECTIATVGKAASVRALLDTLGQPGQVLSIHVDAPVDPARAAIVRPFAGHGARAFANGTARIARHAQVPILPVVSYIDRHGVVQLDYQEPIEPPAPDDSDADNRNTSEMLDTFELVIGRHPDSYIIDFGSERRWDPVAERWSDQSDTGVERFDSMEGPE